MAADPSLTFDAAFAAICQQEATAAAVSTSAASRKEPLLVAAGGSADDLLAAIRASHPEWDSEQVWATRGLSIGHE